MSHETVSKSCSCDIWLFSFWLFEKHRAHRTPRARLVPKTVINFFREFSHAQSPEECHQEPRWYFHGMKLPDWGYTREPVKIVYYSFLYRLSAVFECTCAFMAGLQSSRILNTFIPYDSWKVKSTKSPSFVGKTGRSLKGPWRKVKHRSRYKNL